jgi:nitroreductase
VSIPISYNQSPLDLIRSRTSVRRFTGKNVAGEVRQELERCCQAAQEGPFGGACRFQLIDDHVGSGEQGERVGAYGIISGARTYLAGATGSGGFSLEDFGYLFELLLLKATDLGLGSCWLGGSFTRSRFAKAMGLREEEILPAVSPIGIPTKQRSVVDRVIRWGARSQRRKSWADLFYDAETAAPLSENRAGQFATALDMVRLAPSASNRQPWRCLKEGEMMHICLQRFPGYQAITKTDLQRIDMGIAMAHFDLAMETAGIEGRWQVLSSPFLRAAPLQRPEAWQKAEYLVSWVAEAAVNGLPGHGLPLNGRPEI